jgi:enoyl-CoA hydratase
MSGFRHDVDAQGIAEVVLDKPPVNALNGREWLDLAALLRRLSDDESVRVVVIRAEGRGFCAGVDIKELAQDGSQLPMVERGNYLTFKAVWECRVPVLCAVHGFVLGGGVGISGAADGVFAADDAYFGLPEVDRGALGASTWLVRMFGQQKARMLFFRAARITAPEAYRLGALEKVVPRDQLVEAVREYAGEIAAKSPRAVELAKESMNLVEYPDPARMYRTEQGFTAELYLSNDSLEARRAFVEKREARFE